MTIQRIVIIDYGMGNLNSIQKCFNRLKATTTITCNPDEIKNADKIILPGVGHFGKAMEQLNKLNLIEILNETIITNKKPVLGICLGMQLFANESEEGNVKGLGWIEGKVVKFTTTDKLNYKIPHMGWNEVSFAKKSELLKNIPNLSEFYFVHSFHYNNANKADTLCETEYECNFTSSVEKENIFGVQFHPEKSHDVGQILLKNFIEL
jgi:glutamine amidotransferase